LAEYLWRVRRVSPGVDSPDRVHRRYVELARAVMAAPIDRHLALGSDDAYLDLRTTLVMVAAHEGFSGFIMAGEAAYFVSAVMAPYGFSLTDGHDLLRQRNAFVAEMSRGTDNWTLWTPPANDAFTSPL